MWGSNTHNGVFYGPDQGGVTSTQKVANSARGIAREELRGALRVLHFLYLSLGPCWKRWAITCGAVTPVTAILQARHSG